MKRFFLLLLFALFSVGVWAVAPVATVSFNKMQLSQDGGKTFGDALDVSGVFELASPLVSLTVGNEKQSYDVIETIENPDGVWTYRCTTKENESVSVVYNALAKTVQVSTSVGVSLFRVSGVK